MLLRARGHAFWFETALFSLQSDEENGEERLPISCRRLARDGPIILRQETVIFHVDVHSCCHSDYTRGGYMWGPGTPGLHPSCEPKTAVSHMARLDSRSGSHKSAGSVNASPFTATTVLRARYQHDAELQSLEPACAPCERRINTSGR
jgi:hypothetical protein